MDLEYSWFKRKIHEIAGIDLDSYRPEQMRRLMDRMLDQRGARNYVEFIKYLKGGPDRIQEFKDSMTINVSSLFRDYSKWMELNPFLVESIRKKSAAAGAAPLTFRAWSAGCSIGAEPYTLAMLLQELSIQPGEPRFSYDILCTDIDPTILHRAEDGIFTDKETGETPRRLVRKYFEEIPPPATAWVGKSMASVFYRALPELRKHLRFKIHNMLEDKCEKGFDLIICRNVLIYFTGDTKKRLIERFRDALSGDGLLFLGGTEVIFTPAELGLVSVATCLYKKPLS